MPTTLADLITTATPEQLEAAILASLQANGFPIASWPADSVPSGFVAAEARVLASLRDAIAGIARAGHLDLATGDWLTLLARGRYGLDRAEPRRTVRAVELRDLAGAGPQTIAAGQLWAESDRGLRYNSSAAGKLEKYAGRGQPTDPPALVLQFTAEQPGSTYNLGVIRRLVTPIPGVTAADAGERPIIIAGKDLESDAALRARCKARLPQTAQGPTAAAFEAWALEFDGNINRVRAHASATVPGQIAVIVASPTGVALNHLAELEDYLAQFAPFPATVAVSEASPVAVDFTASVIVPAPLLAAAKANAEAAAQEYVDNVPLSGGLVSAEVLLSCLVRGSPAFPVDGVLDASISLTTDVEVPADCVPILPAGWQSRITWIASDRRNDFIRR